jgi:VanZ family protein
MAAIFIFSATPSPDEPFHLLRYIFYKGGHVIGYAMLSLSFCRALDFGRKYLWLAWLLALLFAATDEYHQSFVAGRHPAVVDVLVYDNLGALIGVWTANQLSKQRQPTHEGLVVEQFTAST